MPEVKYVERDWIQELEERKVITSAEMQWFVQRMGAATVFNAPELAAVLATSVNSIYALCDRGAIGYIDRGSGRKRYCVFPRESVMKFLQDRCNKI
jgi:hypothetical protein